MTVFLVCGYFILMVALILIGFDPMTEWRAYFLLSVIYMICCWALKAFNVIGATKGAKVAQRDKKAYLEERKKAETTLKLLGMCETAANRLGFEVKDSQIFTWDFIINRLFKPIPSINRKMKALELIGIFKITEMFCIFVSIFLFLMTFSAVWVAVALVSLALPGVFSTVFDTMIHAQDKELERDFPDLYLLLFCALEGGVNSRISPSLQDFIRSYNALYDESEHTVIREFVRTLQNNIEVYSAESDALVHMREKYKSALVVNFCNLATQALRGAPVEDRLLSFKMELQNKQKVMMEKEAERRVERGRKAIIFIYIILFEFVVLSWASTIF